MTYQGNQNELLQRDYGCKWQARRFHFKLALGTWSKRGITMGAMKSNMSLRRAGLVACLLLLLTAFCAPPAEAQARLIVRDSLGLSSLNLTCLLTGCQVVRGLGDPQGQRPKPRTTFHRHAPLFVIRVAKCLSRQMKAMRGRIALQKLSQNEIDRRMNFARSALGVRCVLASLITATAAHSPIAS